MHYIPCRVFLYRDSMEMHYSAFYGPIVQLALYASMYNAWYGSMDI